jgi:hypothetical protein
MFLVDKSAIVPIRLVALVMTQTEASTDREASDRFHLRDCKRQRVRRWREALNVYSIDGIEVENLKPALPMKLRNRAQLFRFPHIPLDVYGPLEL